MRRSVPASTAPSAWRCASASAAPSTSSCRRPRPRTRSCCRSARPTASSSQQVPRFLHSASVEPLLIQALLDAPLFSTRWRWNATISLAIRRSRAGKKTPAPLQRMAAEDLIAVVFPDQLACAENLSGEREIPDHPLVRQTVFDSLHEAMDSRRADHAAARDRARRGAGDRARSAAALAAGTGDSAAPVPTPIWTTRRSRSGARRRWRRGAGSIRRSAAQFGQLDAAAIAAVRSEAWPGAETADELHDALMLLGVITGPRVRRRCAARSAVRRAGRVAPRDASCTAAQRRFWVAAEQLPMIRALYVPGVTTPALRDTRGLREPRWEPADALRELLRGRLQAIGPTSAQALARMLAQPSARDRDCADRARGRRIRDARALHAAAPASSNGASGGCWRAFIATRSSRCAPRSSRSSSGDFMRFLLDWQGVTAQPRPEGVGQP